MMAVQNVPLLETCMFSLPSIVADAIKALQLPLCSSPIDGDYLDCENGLLVLRTVNGETVSATMTHPARFHGKQPLITAISPARGGTIIDATAGMGDDTLKLAMIANHVIAIERHPVVYALLVSALYSAQQASVPGASRVELLFGDAKTIIPQQKQADVIYIDPMFPDKRKQSALPPKAVRILRNLVGRDSDSERLLEVARRCAGKRVVVKRPLHAPDMAGDAVARHAGKVVRYEVYLPTGSSA